jgi:uncharacterized membrane protein YbaN (DUF454 family)
MCVFAFYSNTNMDVEFRIMNQLESAFFGKRLWKENKMNKIKKAFWFTLGILLVGVAYLGVILPGLPWSTPILGAAFCFAKSSKRFHDWIMNHKTFGPFITEWQTYKVYPQKAKYLMMVVMATSLGFMYWGTGNLMATFYLFILFVLIVTWAWRYPGSKEESKRRKKAGKRLGWLK